MSMYMRRQTIAFATLLILSAQASLAEPPGTQNEGNATMQKAGKAVIPGKITDGASNTQSRDGRGTNGGNIIADDQIVVEGSAGKVVIKGNSAKGGSGNKVTF